MNLPVDEPTMSGAMLRSSCWTCRCRRHGAAALIPVRPCVRKISSIDAMLLDVRCYYYHFSSSISPVAFLLKFVPPLVWVGCSFNFVITEKDHLSTWLDLRHAFFHSAMALVAYKNYAFSQLYHINSPDGCQQRRRCTTRRRLCRCY